MARPLRIEFEGAVYHVMARGNRRERIYNDDEDFARFIDVLGEVCSRYNWTIHAYCLMTNHYHALVETPDANLSSGMRYLNGVYAQSFNRRHHRVGHVFQGRFKPILVQKTTHLLEVGRYVVLNPVRGRMVDRAEDWMWSSYLSTIGLGQCPEWLDSDWLLSQFDSNRPAAVKAYQEFVAVGRDASNPLLSTSAKLYLGDDAFADAVRLLVSQKPLREVSKAQKRASALGLDEYRQTSTSRNEAMAKAYASGAYTMREIADFFGVHYMTVSRAIRRQRNLYECEN